MKSILIFSILFLSFFSFTQEDSSTVLTYDEYMAMVFDNHPAFYQAQLAGQRGEANLLSAKGGFDPKLYGNLNQKYFGEKQYYSHGKAGLKIPTWFGITADAGYTLNDGYYLNPEMRVPSAGLWYAGLQVELGNGLIIDQRRAELKKAQIYYNSTQLEQQIMLNQLQLDASIAYYKWRKAYEKFKVYESSVDNALIRFEAVKSSAKFGDRPYIDTTESYMTVQTRLISLSQSQNELLNAQAYLEIFLWADGYVPMELENRVPEQSQNDISGPVYIADSLIQNHPYLQLAQNKISTYKVDLRYKQEQLKPQLTLKYNAISEPINDNPFTEYDPMNYTWGAAVQYPILTRKERGQTQLAKIKLQDQELEVAQVEQTIMYKIISARNNLTQAIEQRDIYEKYVENAQRLYDSELQLFELGESSVFMINSRENNYLKVRTAYIEILNLCYQLEAELAFQLMLVSQ